MNGWDDRDGEPRVARRKSVSENRIEIAARSMSGAGLKSSTMSGTTGECFSASVEALEGFHKGSSLKLCCWLDVEFGVARSLPHPSVGYLGKERSRTILFSFGVASWTVPTLTQTAAYARSGRTDFCTCRTYLVEMGPRSQPAASRRGRSGWVYNRVEKIAGQTSNDRACARSPLSPMQLEQCLGVQTGARSR